MNLQFVLWMDKLNANLPLIENRIEACPPSAMATHSRVLNRPLLTLTRLSTPVFPNLGLSSVIVKTFCSSWVAFFCWEHLVAKLVVNISLSYLFNQPRLASVQNKPIFRWTDLLGNWKVKLGEIRLSFQCMKCIILYLPLFSVQLAKHT